MKTACIYSIVNKLFIVLILLPVMTLVNARPLPDFTPLVDSNAAAVVNISTSINNSG